MPATVYKNLNKNSPGTSSTYGADDWDILGRWHSDVDLSATASSSVKTNTSFWDNRLRVWNPAKTKSYRIRGLAILNDYDITLPLLTGNDEFAALMSTQEMQNKTVNVNLNTLKNTSNSIGQLLVGDGTKYLPLAMGSTAGHVLTINPGVNGLQWAAAAGGGGGETNTASNVGTAGVGMFKQKTGVNLEFKKLNTASGGLITVTDDTANNEVDLKITGGTDGQMLKTVGTTPTWSTESFLTYGLNDPDLSQLGWLNTRHETAHNGALNGICVATGTPSFPSGTNGLFVRYTTGSTSGNQAGFRTNQVIMERQHTPSPRIMGRFSIGDTTSERVFIGWIGANSFSFSGDPLNATNGFGLWVDHGVSANIRNMRNDAAGVSVQGDYSPTVAVGTGYHEFEIIADNANARFGLSVDGNAFQYQTTDIPANSAEMYLQVWCETTTAAGRRLDLSKLILQTGANQ